MSGKLHSRQCIKPQSILFDFAGAGHFAYNYHLPSVELEAQAVVATATGSIVSANLAIGFTRISAAHTVESSPYI